MSILQGVEGALYEVFPRATRRICSQHLYQNFSKAGYNGGAFQKLFWTAADAHNSYVYNKALEKIGKLDPAAKAYLMDIEEQWSRHKFEPHVCCDHNTTNFVESLNSITQKYRDLPVLTLLEGLCSICSFFDVKALLIYVSLIDSFLFFSH